MKINHYSIFNAVSSKKIDWNILREEELELSYFLPNTRFKYLQKFNKERVSDYILSIIKQINNLGYTKLLSLGSGIGQAEYQILKYSNLNVVVSDNSNSIIRLKEFGIFHDVLFIDILNDDFPVDENTIVLLHRIDTEFNDNDLINIFDKLKKSRVRHICFVPTNPFVTKILISELKTILLAILKFKKRTFCGYCRSKSSLVKLWEKSYHEIYDYEQEKSFYILQLRDE